MAVPQIDRVELNYTLTFTMPFHFGTGMRSGLLDRTVTRDANGYLYMPASTLKGVWREKCEQLERFCTGKRGEELVDTPHDAKMALRGLGYTRTMSSRIFGSQQHPGHLFFEDARMLKEEQALFDSPGNNGKGRNKSLQTSSYTQVRLERSTHTSVPGALYTSEFGRRDLLFHGSVTGWLTCMAVPRLEVPAPTCSLLLLLAGLQMVERLGGNKSAGKGACTCEITSLKLNGSKEKLPIGIWQGWLEHLDLLAGYDYALKEEEEEE